MGDMSPRHAIRSQYAEWLLMDNRARLVHGLPKTDAEFAKLKGTTARTLRRWRKDDPAFAELVEQRRLEVAGELDPDSAVAAAYPVRDARAKRRYERRGPAGPGDDPAALSGAAPGTAEYEYHEIRTALAAKARDGDVQAGQAWMKLFGEPYIEAERADLASQFAELDDDRLVDETLTLIGAERVAGWLADRTAEVAS